jgi:hypothetical protein
MLAASVPPSRWPRERFNLILLPTSVTNLKAEPKPPTPHQSQSAGSSHPAPRFLRGSVPPQGPASGLQPEQVSYGFSVDCSPYAWFYLGHHAVVSGEATVSTVLTKGLEHGVLCSRLLTAPVLPQASSIW